MSGRGLENYTALLEAVPSAIIQVDPQGLISYWNKAAEKMYGWNAEEAIGSSWNDFFPTPSVEYRFPPSSHLFEDGRWEGELSQKDRYGNVVLVEARWRMLRDTSGMSESVLAIHTDITAKRTLEQQFLRSQRLESLGILAGGLAHDLNNILTPILVSIGSLRGIASDEETVETLDTLEIVATRGAGIVQQILAFSRGAGGERTIIELHHTFRELRLIIEETFPRTITLVFDLAAGLWPIEGDASQLHQIFLNLCLNAEDAMHGRGTLTVTAANTTIAHEWTGTRPDVLPGRYVVVRVEDTGEGIAHGNIEKIFDPFFTTKSEGNGTGLGLATVDTILTSMGGFVDVVSEPDGGSRFSVYFPAAKEGEVSEEEIPVLEVPRGSGEGILVVDDEPAIRSIVKKILESNGYKVYTAHDGIYGLYLYVKFSEEISVVLTDLVMPKLDGPSMIHAMQKLDSSAKFIVVSGLSDQSTEDPELPVDAVLRKPFTSNTLLEVIYRTIHELR